MIISLSQLSYFDKYFSLRSFGFSHNFLPSLTIPPVRVAHAGQSRDQVHAARRVRGLLPGGEAAGRHIHGARLHEGAQYMRHAQRRRRQLRPAEIHQGGVSKDTSP